MVNRELIAGVDSFLLFGTESTFGTKASTIDQPLGLITDFRPRITRNAIEHRGFTGSTSGGQLPEKVTTGNFVNTFTIEFKPLEWGILEHIFGTVAGAGTAASKFIYTFANKPTSLTFVHNLNNDTTDRAEIQLGCKIETFTIRASVGESVTISSDWQAADFNKASSLESNVALPTGEIFNFSGATLELPDGSAISHIIDTIEIRINRATKRRTGLGNFTASQILHGATEIRLTFTIDYLDETFIEDTMGGTTTLSNLTENATLTVNFATTDANKSIDFKFTNISFPDFSETATLNEIITEEITGFARGLTAEEQVSA